jgi:MOSC domain-containing protein
MPRARITALNVYPVKSCRGLSPREVRVATRGLVAATAAGDVWDREWMIVDPDGRFVTQRENPRLALIATSVADGALVLASAGRTPLAVSLAHPRDASREVVVWKSVVPAHDAGDGAAAWLSSVLGGKVRLVRFDPAHRRLCNPDYAGESGAHTAFADGYPLLVIGEASLGDLNRRLEDKSASALPMNRFRPNIVLEGLEAYDEDHVDTLTADGVVMKIVKPCARCQITTTDQDSGRVGVEPLETLGVYRMNERVGGVTFGVNAIIVDGQGRALSVGMDVEASFAF